MLLHLAKVAASLSEFAGASISSLPGVAPDPKTGMDALRKTQPVLNGMEGRLLRGLGAGVPKQGLQGPRAYAPRLSKT